MANVLQPLENIRANTIKLANEIGATVIYDGEAIYAATTRGVNVFYETQENAKLHQNKHGAYLSAACIFKNITNKSTLTNITYTYNDLTYYATMIEVANSNC